MQQWEARSVRRSHRFAAATPLRAGDFLIAGGYPDDNRNTADANSLSRHQCLEHSSTLRRPYPPTVQHDAVDTK